MVEFFYAQIILQIIFILIFDIHTCFFCAAYIADRFITFPKKILTTISWVTLWFKLMVIPQSLLTHKLVT